MGLREFAEKELKIIEDQCQDEEALNLQKMVTKDILEIVDIFVAQKHSGASAAYMLDNLNRLLRYKPLTPLQGTEEEWDDISKYQNGKKSWQNNRCYSVFKEENGNVYDTEGKLFSDDNGHTWYNCPQSRVLITFPYIVPLYPECVITDNIKERAQMLSYIKSLISANNIKTNTEVTEESNLQDLFDKEDISDFIYCLKEHTESIKDKKIYEDDYIYRIITLLLEGNENEN